MPALPDPAKPDAAPPAAVLAPAALVPSGLVELAEHPARAKITEPAQIRLFEVFFIFDAAEAEVETFSPPYARIASIPFTSASLCTKAREYCTSTRAEPRSLKAESNFCAAV